MNKETVRESMMDRARQVGWSIAESEIRPQAQTTFRILEMIEKAGYSWAIIGGLPCFIQGVTDGYKDIDIVTDLPYKYILDICRIQNLETASRSEWSVCGIHSSGVFDIIRCCGTDPFNLAQNFCIIASIHHDGAHTIPTHHVDDGMFKIHGQYAAAMQGTEISSMHWEVRWASKLGVKCNVPSIAHRLKRPRPNSDPPSGLARQIGSVMSMRCLHEVVINMQRTGLLDAFRCKDKEAVRILLDRIPSMDYQKTGFHHGNFWEYVYGEEMVPRLFGLGVPDSFVNMIVRENMRIHQQPITTGPFDPVEEWTFARIVSKQQAQLLIEDVGASF